MQNSEFKKVLIKFLILAALMIVTDIVIGHGLSYINNQEASEMTCKYVMDEVNHDIVIFGSSRAYRHYDTRVISDSLGLTCYNCGQSGMGFIHNYVLLESLLKRYTPKLIIYDIYPPADFIEGDNTRYIINLRPYRDRNDILDVLKDVDKLEEYKTLSSMYCYNYILNEMLLHYFNLISGKSSINGFVPTKKDFKSRNSFIEDGQNIDTLKLKYADLFIKIAKKTNVVLSMSPYWYKVNPQHIEIAKNIAKKNTVPFIDFSSHNTFIHNNDYFYDEIHMNERGAEKFTREIVKKLFK